MTPLRATMLLLGLAAVPTGCGSSDPQTPAPLVTISNFWTEVGNDAHTFDLSSNDDGKREGTFLGTETLPSGTSFDLEGSWSDGQVRFTVHRAIDLTYTATVSEDNQTRLTFHSSAGTLVIEHG
jgi:hypothetical protein